MTEPSVSERSMQAQAAAYMSWANTADRAERTRKAREAFEAKFLAENDNDPQRAAAARKAYYRRMILRSVQARKRKALGGADVTT